MTAWVMEMCVCPCPPVVPDKFLVTSTNVSGGLVCRHKTITVNGVVNGK